MGMYYCDGCGKEIKDKTNGSECIRIVHCERPENILCLSCNDVPSMYDLALSGKLEKWKEPKGSEMPTIPLIKEFNEPPHYHKYEIDTIEFLQKGFPPEVFKGFAIGSTVKYLHRYENKNGMEDLEKALDYIKRLIEFHKEH
jgi:hypothetical protein